MTSISSLAPETLGFILEHLTEPGDPLEGYESLAAASLVARSWREPAQALLWRDLDLHDPELAECILESPACGKFRTRTVTTDLGDWEGTGLTAGEVIGKFKGVEELEIWSFGHEGIDVSWVNFESLADLKTLHILANFSDETVLDDLHPAFHLRTLEIGHLTSAALVHALFATSATSLVTLTLLFRYTKIPALRSGLIASLPLVANTLETLTLKDFTLVPGLGAILSTFTSLSSLSLEINNLLAS